jgi:hypothetical protein
VTREPRGSEHGNDTRKLFYNNPNLGNYNFAPVCVYLQDQRNDSPAPDPSGPPFSETREPANERATSKLATERATAKPATERVPIKPALEWAITKPAHEWATTKPAPEQAHKAAPKVPKPASRPVAPLPATCANQPVCATEYELSDLVADLAAKYSAASSWTTFVENFRGDEGDFHAEVKSIPHVAAPLLE